MLANRNIDTYGLSLNQGIRDHCHIVPKSYPKPRRPVVKMVLFKSPHPDLDSKSQRQSFLSQTRANNIEVPTDLTTWEWAFEHPSHSPVASTTSNTPGAYIDALDPSSRLSFAQVKEHATHLSNALVHSYNLQPGETVSLFATNSIWYPVAMWAALRVGGRINGASPAYGVDEMVHAMKTAGSRIIFTLPSCLEVAIEAAKIVGLSRDRIFLLEGHTNGVRCLKDLMKEGKQMEETPVWRIPAGKTNRDICGYGRFSVNDARLILTRSQLSQFLVRHHRPPKSGHAQLSQHHRAMPSTPATPNRLPGTEIQDPSRHATVPHHGLSTLLHLSPLDERGLLHDDEIRSRRHD